MVRAAREGDHKHRAAAGLALLADRPPVGLDHLADEGQPETDAAVLPGVTAEEAVEDPVPVGAGHAGPVVAVTDLHPVLVEQPDRLDADMDAELVDVADDLARVLHQLDEGAFQ